MRIHICSSLVAVLLAAASGCGVATGNEPEESTATAAAALSIDPMAPTTYAYFRSAGTDWGADAGSAMQKTGNGVWKKTFHVTEPWMLTSGLTANVTLTNQQNGWGTKSATLTDPAHQSTPYRQLGTTASLVEGSTALRIAPPALGDYEVTFNAASLTYVVAQPVATKSFSIYVSVDDDIHPREYARRLCRAIQQLHLPLEWSCLINPAFPDEELFHLIREAGGYQVQVGNESGSDLVLTNLGKRFSRSQVEETLTLLQQVGLPYNCFLLLGGPGETPATVRESVELLERYTPFMVNLTVGIRIYPHTALCDQAMAEGVIAPGDNLLWPHFYLSAAVADWIWDYLKEVISRHPNWIF